MKYSILSLALIVSSCLISCQPPEGKDQYCKSSDGVKICYAEYGSGDQLIVFIHGWCCDKSYWRKQIDYFKDDFHVVTIDLGGHGNSGTNRKDWTMSAYGDDVNSVLKKLDFEEVYLVGHSMGATVTLEVASKWTKDNLELFLADHFIDTPVKNVKQFEKFIKPFENDFVNYSSQWVKSLMFIPETNPELIKWITNDISKANQKVAISAIRNMFNIDYLPIIHNLNDRGVPMTLINSDYRPSNLDNLDKLGFKVVTMSDCGHFVMLEQPETFNNLLRKVIKEE